MASTQAKGVRGESFDLPSQSNFNRPIATMNRLVQLLALVLIASLLLVDIASAAEASPKLKLLRSKQDHSGVIDLSSDSEMLTSVLFKGPRDYTVILSFSSATPRFPCGVCLAWDETFATVARAHHTMENKSETLFFIRADVGRMDPKGINFIKNHVGGLPYVAKVKPTESKVLQFDIERSGLYNPTSMEATDFAVWVNKNTDVHIRIPNYKRILMISGTVGIVGILGYLLFDTFWQWAQNPMLYFAASLVGYCIVCGGAVFSFIHKVPFVGMDRQGNPMWFVAGHSREQFGAEALIMATIVGGGSIGWILVGGHLPNSRRPRSAIFFAFLLTLTIMALARNLFKWKHPYYPY